MSLVKDYLKSIGCKTADDACYSSIEKWLGWYSGKVNSFHSYSQYNGKTNVKRSRASLCMAKFVCEDWANLLLNEHVLISADNRRADAFLNSVLESNNFKVRANRLVELSFALGTGAFVEYTDGGNVKIDYVRANMIFPLAWENGEITQCAFASEKTVDGVRCVYLNMHIMENGQYKIVNRLFTVSGETLTERALPGGVEAEVYTGSTQPLFQIVSPNIVNSTALDSPLGISVFAGAIDILKGIDLVYDSYQNEFRLGKKRILVPAGMAQMQSGTTGVMPIFDDNDTEFYAMADRSLSDLKEIDMNLRAQPHELALQRNLDLLSERCGLGNGRYNRGTATAPKTATEVISQKSDLYVNIRKNELVLEHALKGMCRAICFLGKIKRTPEISVRFDDSIIEDSASLAQRALEEFKCGIISKDEYLQRVYGKAAGGEGE